MNGNEIRKIVLEQSWRAHVGHIGSNLSIADLVAVLYGEVLRIAQPEDPERDRFILSKGHAALALYAALFLRAWITPKDLNSFAEAQTRFGTHPDRSVRGIDFATGSLGQGLPYAVGSALAARMERSSRRVFALLSDAECNEGSTWEAVMFAAHHHLSNLYAVIDVNGQQAFGYTREVLSLSPLAERWRAFGWDAAVVDGHDAAAIRQAIERTSANADQPHVLLAETVFGKGVSFMEKRLDWHYLPLSEEQYRTAMADLERT